jgi:DNA-binding NarL/FixJ family response regulator
MSVLETDTEKKSHTTKIMLVDDHPIVRQGVRRLVESRNNFEVCFEIGKAGEAITHIEDGPCDAAIIDISIEGRSGVELIEDIRSRGFSFPILVLSIHDEVVYAEKALAAGAQGYVIKHQDPETIITALETILEGKVYVCEQLASKLISKLSRKSPAEPNQNLFDTLSKRELEILEQIGKGNSTKQIAWELSLSVSTIETYKTRIKEKLKLQSATELTTFAVRWLINHN